MSTFFVTVTQSTNDDCKNGELCTRMSWVEVTADTPHEAEIIAAQIAASTYEAIVTGENSPMPTSTEIDWEATIAREMRDT